jgi:DNA topoisomerase-2
MSVERKYKKLTDQEHVLQRPSMYLGSMKPNTSSKWLVNSQTLEKKDITYIPAFIKLFDEIIINSIDESKRAESKLNTIKINVDKSSITVWDNGGILVKKNKGGEWIPEMVFSNMRAGSNFSDEENRTWAGTNGVGSSCVNIFSKEFKISTCDGENHFLQTFTNNMSQRTKSQIKKSKKNHTEISFTPDFERFGLTEIDEPHSKMIEKRVYDIAACNPSIKIYYNDKLINFKSFEDYIKLYTSDYFYESKKDKSWSIGISVSDNGFQQVSFVNSTETYDGGTHVDYITNQIVAALREFFQKKHKVDVKPSELKNHMFLFVNSTVVNPSFSSQTKEKLITEVKEFGTQFEISPKFIQSILKSEIVASILDWIEQKKNAEENKAARELNKNVSKIKVDKLIDAKGKDRWKCTLSLFEGDSAIGGFRKYRDTNLQGGFALRGKFVNVSEITNQKLVTNVEVTNLMGALGLKLGHKVVPGTLRYGKILLYVDADQDGNSIAALLINFLHKFWPELFEHKMVYKVDTPIVVCQNKAKKKISFYHQNDYNEWLKKVNPKDWEIKYKKGLAALVDDEYREIIHNPRLTCIRKDQVSSQSLSIWFGKESDHRKIEILK